MREYGKILYIGGFELPDKNAAAQRVIGIAKGFRALGYEVEFLNSIKLHDANENRKEYYGFRTTEYKRESNWDYLITAKTCLKNIKTIEPNIIIAYNYPALALNRIRMFCQKKRIKVFGDVTEWYHQEEGSLIFRIIKNTDTFLRMRYVHKRLSGIIAISRFLYEYYKRKLQTVLIPPTVDIEDEKWDIKTKEANCECIFVYAGSPSAQKERLDKIVNSFERIQTEINARLDVLGISEDQFKIIYEWKKTIPPNVTFHGRVAHRQAIEATKNSNWAIIIRDNNWVVNAGFPTKLVESISCGTPVIVNRFSNIEDYLDQTNSIVISDFNKLDEHIIQAAEQKKIVDRTIFDYNRFANELMELTKVTTRSISGGG